MPNLVTVPIAATGASESKSANPNTGAPTTTEENAASFEVMTSSSADAAGESENQNDKAEVMMEEGDDYTMEVESVSVNLISAESLAGHEQPKEGESKTISSEGTSESKHERNEKKGETSMDLGDSEENHIPVADNSKEEGNENPLGTDSSDAKPKSIEHEGMSSIGKNDSPADVSENGKPNEDENESNGAKFDKTDFNVGLFQFVLAKAENGGKSDFKGTNKHLRAWMNHQNSCLKGQEKGAITQLMKQQIAVLDELDFPWKLSRDESWNKNFQDLVKFHEANGHCRVPRSADLGEWVSNQRKGMKHRVKGKPSSLTKERIQMLDSIDFVYDLHDWNVNYLQLCNYQKELGHCSPPRTFGTLGRWVSYQRESYRNLKDGKKTTITQDRIKKLEDVGFKWKPLK